MTPTNDRPQGLKSCANPAMAKMAPQTASLIIAYSGHGRMPPR